MKSFGRLAILACILAALGAGVWLASRGTGPDRRNLDALVTVGGDAMKDALHPAIDLTRMSVADEVRLGNAIDSEIRAHMKVGSDPTTDIYLKDILDRLRRGVLRTQIPYSIALVESPEINAFAVAGGHVYVMQGMLQFVESEAELAVVIGHEVSHVDLRHCVERLQLERAARKIDPGLASLARLGYEIAQLGFSEEQELAADENGAALAAVASYDPWEAMTLFTRFEAQEAKGERSPTRNPVKAAVVILPEALGRYLATHPPADQRREAVRRTLMGRPVLWKNKGLYLGRQNLQRRQSLTAHPDPSEWLTRSAPPS